MGSSQTDRLEAILQSSRNANEPELKAVLARLSSELKDRLQKSAPESSDFFISSVRALGKLRGAAHSEVRMTCLFDSVVYLFSNRFDEEASSAAQLLDMLAEQVGDKSWLRRSKLLQGITYAHMGNIAEAVPAYANALSIAREIGDLEGEASILVNLGNTLNYGGLYREAIPCLLQGAAFSENQSATWRYRPAALCNLAQSYLYLGDYGRGFEAISKAVELSEDPKNAFDGMARAVREFTYVQLALELGKLEDARKHATACAAFAQKSGTRRCDYIALVARGLCEIHGGDARTGIELLEKSLEVAGEEGTPPHTAALCALVRGYDHAEQPEQALIRMNQLMSNLRAVREKGVIALWASDSAARNIAALTSEQNDLQALHLREAQLRARVAEREAINSRLELLERFAVTADLKEDSSGEHGYRVGRLSSLLAEDLGWDKVAIHAIDLAARLHDIGKMAVPDRILLSSNKLLDAERHFIWAHTSIGAELLARSNESHLKIAEEIARFHHEWWNGEGYPAKLAGKRIPIHARIVALADVFDALTHGRPFAKPWPMDQAIEEIRKRRGTQFDPELTDVFLKLIERLRHEHADLDEYLGRAGRNSPFLQARNKIRLMLAEERENEKKATVEGNGTRH